ncbi:calcineurin-like phosphoesterase [Aureococcus anophagefferens]|nr:calcineurin-like phosphoesterase [Aureococcus anophagefferens]
MTTAVDFCFVDAEDEPVELERFYFTIFDVDQQRKENRHSELLCVDSDQYDSYVLAGATSLDIEERDVACDGSPGASTTFASTSAGFECDNPTDAQNLGEATTGFNGGRNFIFGGSSSLCDWPTRAPTHAPTTGRPTESHAPSATAAPSVAPTASAPPSATPAPSGTASPTAAPTTAAPSYTPAPTATASPTVEPSSPLPSASPAPSAPTAAPSTLWNICDGPEYELYIEGSILKANNLGGVGPGDDSDEVLRYSEVTEKDGRPVDLVVSVQDGHEYEVADNYAFDEYVLRDSTSLNVETHDTACDGSEGSSVTFASTAAGFICDNPTDPQQLGQIFCADQRPAARLREILTTDTTGEECDQCVDQGFDEYFPIDQAERSVMFVFRAPRSSFDLSYTLPCVDCFLDATTGFNGGRNFLFGGSSSLCIWPTPTPTVATTEYWGICDGPEYEPAYELSIDATEITMNNLGGVGPNADDDPVLRYAHVTEKDERPVDLVVSVRDGHEYLTADNFAEYQGAWEMFGQINVRDDSTAHLTFSFVDSETSAPVVLERFYVTVFDIDQQRSENRHTERLCVDNDQYDEYVLRESASLVFEAQDTACDGSEGSSVTFQNDIGEDCDQCIDQGFDEYFPIDQAERSVMFVFRAPRSSFDLSYTLPCVDCFLDATTGFNGGRNFLFGGSSSLCVWPTPAPTSRPSDAPTRVPATPTAVPTSSAPTTDDFCWHTCEDPFHDFSLENDVAGAGELLRFAAATTLDGAAVDLVVAAADGAAGDGVSGATRDKFGFVGVPDDARVDLELAFEDAGGDAVALRRFYVSVVDIDVEAGRREELCVDDGEYDEYVLGKNSSLSVEARDAACDGGPGASTVFAATEAGFSCDDPTNPMRLNTVFCEECRECLDDGLELVSALAFPVVHTERGVMFVLRREKRSAMRLSYAVACDGCEAGGASGMLFAGASSLCTFESEAWETCNDGDATLQLEGAELVSNNLGGAGPVFSDPEVLRYAGVVERTDDSPVDLVVSAVDGAYRTADNYALYQGLWNQYGQINVRDNSTARLRFSFVDAATDLAVGLERFYVTIFDIDQQRKPNRHREMLCIDDDQYEDYVLGGDPTLDVSSSPRRCDGSAGSTSTSFLSTAAGFICDNPSGAASDPLDLGTVVCAECDQCVAQGFDAYFPINQADRSVMFTFEKERMSFDLSYTLPCEDCFLEELTGFNGGRNFLFGGESSLCAWPTMAPTAPAWVTCSGSDVALEIEGAELVANNLGGAGPAFGDEPVLRYADVWRGDGSPVDLVVSVQEGTDYAVADDYANYQGLWNQYGQINVRDNSTAHLVFSFVDSATERPVGLERFYFTIFDIDQQRNENRHREMLCAASASTKRGAPMLTLDRAGIDDDQYDDYVLGGDPTLEISRRATRCDGSAGASTTFLSTAAGFECDNPQFLGTVACEDCAQCVDQGFDEYFPIDQADRSVMFTFREARDSFTLSYTLPCADCFLDATTGFNGGRNFLFGGESSLCAWPTPAPTAPADAWPACGGACDFDLSAATLAANDLGGAGPDAGDAPVIRYAGATVKDARPVDLEVSAVGEYLPADDLAGQGLDGAVGRVSVRDNSTARLRFAFKDGYDGGSVDLAEFYVTFLDLDGDADPRRHRETLCVDDDAFDDYVVSENSELAVAARERRCDGSRGSSVTFSSTAAGFDCDDAAAPDDLELVTCARCDECAAEGLDAFFPVDQRDRAVMLVFREPRASFEVSYGVPCLDCLTPDLVGFHGGRHASFAGASSLCSWPTSAPTLSPKPSTRPTVTNVTGAPSTSPAPSLSPRADGERRAECGGPRRARAVPGQR